MRLDVNSDANVKSIIDLAQEIRDFSFERAEHYFPINDDSTGSFISLILSLSVTLNILIKAYIESQELTKDEEIKLKTAMMKLIEDPF